MNVVMLSGGSGQRLWPLSNNVRSKQFLKLLRDNNNQLESMVQRVFRQLQESGLDSKIVIATSESQVESVNAQLGDQVEIVVEPERRDTFPAIALSVAYLYYNNDIDEEDSVVVMPVDPYTDIDFFHKIEELNQKILQSDYNLGLLAIKPTYASSKYGYILNEDNQVTGFMEKPSEEVAAEIIAKGAYWNGGVFIMKIKYILNILEKYIEFSSYEEVLKQYDKLPKNSFDYEVSEKETNITMVKYEGDWKDLGTWKTLTEEMESKTLGEVTLSEDSTNTHVINETDIPIITIGAQNMVIAASQDGILVSDKVESAKLKNYINTSTRQPMYEETYYGHRKILDIRNQKEVVQTITSLIYMDKGFTLTYEADPNYQYSVTVVEGTGELISENDNRTALQVNTILKLDKKTNYNIRSLSNLTLLEVKSVE